MKKNRSRAKEDKRERLLQEMAQQLKSQLGVADANFHVCDKQKVIKLAESSPGLLMCIPIQTPDLPEGGLYAGSIVVKAECCGCEVYLGPRQAAKRANDGWPIVCVMCMQITGILDDPRVEMQHLGNPD